MVDHLAIQAVEKAINLGLAGFGWVFILVESLTKRVDVPAMKERLDLREAQVMAGVIVEIETAILPHLAAPPSNFTIDEVEGEVDQLEEVEYEAPTALSERAKDALAKTLRKIGGNLDQMHQIRLLPSSIHRLNSHVFWCVLAVAILASIGLSLEYVISPLPVWVEVLTVVTPSSGATAAVFCSVKRHLKVQSAEKHIIDNSWPN